MENAVMMRALGRADRIDRRPHKILLSCCEELSSFLTRIRRRGVGIVKPQHLLEDITSMIIEATTALANEDFINILTTIREAVVLQYGVAFAIHLGDEDWIFVIVKDDSLDDVDTVEESTYSEFRRESMIGDEGSEEYLQQVEESLEAVIQHVVENPDVVLQPSEGSSGKWWYSRKKKLPSSVIKKIKQ